MERAFCAGPIPHGPPMRRHRKQELAMLSLPWRPPPSSTMILLAHRYLPSLYSRFL